MAKYEKVGSGSYGVYKKKSDAGVVFAWVAIGIFVIAVLA